VNELTGSIFPRHRKTFVTISAALLAFLAYSSVYAFRKPFTVATFEGIQYWGVTYQTLLIICQVLGYMLSKFAGIKLISELKSLGRFRMAVTLIVLAWLCLLLFAIMPAPFGLLCLFVNGFTLGFLWGIVFSYMEGRRATDLIGSVLAVSFIFAGGFTRSVAKWLMINYQVTERWMPFFTGLIFILPLVVLLWGLDKIPPPDASDQAERGVRLPLDHLGRKNLLKEFGPGLAVVTMTYFFLTVMRDIRDNYMANIWNELGYGNNFSILTTTETVTSLVVISVMGLLVLIRKNMRAFAIIHFVIIGGFLIVVIASLLFSAGKLSGALWMQLISVGLYLGYIPFNCIFFERMIATYRITGNVGFLIYLADSFGYLGSVTIMLVKEFMQVNVSWSQFYASGVVYGSAAGIIGAAFSYYYFLSKYRTQKPGLATSM
jgi:MFS family permease